MSSNVADRMPPQIPLTALQTGNDFSRESWDWDNGLAQRQYDGSGSHREGELASTETPAQLHDDNVRLLPPTNPGPQQGETQSDGKMPRIRKPSRFGELLQWSSDNWVFEISALITSAVCLTGIVTTLLLHGDRPLPEWPFGIKINALISTLSTISRSALAVGVSAAVSQRQWIRLNRGVHPLADLEMHDSASRGPWGSMSLLISLGWSDIVSLGAMVTILSLAMDPFVQQIATFESAPAPFGNSSIASRVIFEAGMNSTDNSVFYQGFVQAPQSFSPHIYQGLYFDGDLNDNFLRNSLQLHPRSSGGNVSYGVSESLAVCSACANLTDKLRAPERSAKDPDQCSTDEGWCKWDLPNGASSGWTRFGDRSTNVMGLNATTDPVVLNTTGQLRILYVNAILPGWEITSRDDDDQPIDGVGVEGLAQECALYWCVNKYESSLSAGIFNETIISSFSAGDFEPEPFHRVFAIRPPGSNSSFHRGNSHDYGNYSTGWINGTFLVNVDASGLIQRPLEELFSGYATTLNSYQEWAPISSNPTVLRLYMTARKHDPSQVPRFDMSNIMEAVALGMSTVLRTTDPTHEGNDALKSVVGTETAMQIIVRVRWAWIVLPVILQLAAHLFFWQTMITSRSRRLNSWKSSALAVFFFGARKEREVAHSEVERLIDMEAIAKETVIVVEGRKSKGI